MAGRAAHIRPARRDASQNVNYPSANYTRSVDDVGKDAVDVILEQWQREQPDLDVSYVRVLGRLTQVSRLLVASAERVFERYGLHQAEFDVLTTLLRSGPPYTLIPSAIAESLMMSRAGMTSRLDRLEKADLVERTIDPDDRRSFRVALTDQGREVAGAVMNETAAYMNKLISSLDPSDRECMERGLRTLLVRLEDQD